MGAAREHPGVRAILGILSAFADLIDLAADRAEAIFGPADLRSEVFPFDFTDYYREEMGPDIKRRFLSYPRLIAPDRLAEIKIRTNRLEAEIARDHSRGVPRPVNVDPGYLALDKLVLATTKDYSHRIYLRDGIYAEATLRFRHGRFEPWPWTYPDYRTEAYTRFFLQVRQAYRRQMAAAGE